MTALQSAASKPLERGQAIGVLTLSVLLYAGSWPIMKLALADATPLWYAAVRAWLSTLSAFILVIALGRLKLPDRHDVPVIVTIGLFQMSAFYFCSTLGLRHVDAGRSAILAYTTTLWIAPISRLIGEPMTRQQILGVLVGLAGVVVLIDPMRLDWTDLDVIEGHGWLLMAALGWAIGIVHSRRHVWRGAILELLPWQLVVASLSLVPIAFLLEPDGHLGTSVAAWGSLAYVASIVGPFGSWAATSVARSLPTMVTSLGFLGVPVAGLFASVIWLGEPLTLPVMLGAALILAGVAVVSFPKRQ